MEGWVEVTKNCQKCGAQQTTPKCRFCGSLTRSVQYKEWTFPKTRYGGFPEKTTDPNLDAPLPDGPWMREPDKIQWTDEDTGLPCLIVRGPSGALCGYVGVSKDHPWFRVDYSACPKGDACDKADDWGCEHRPDSRVEVHGGLTFSSLCSGDPQGRTICHYAPGEDHVWWFGFDCAHSGDLCPAYSPHDISWESYKDRAYVEAECRKLAQQLSEVA